jgi:hypothetical protein
MAYAELAGLPPVTGSYTTVACPTLDTALAEVQGSDGADSGGDSS